MKIPLQEKIAELEARIAKLEKAQRPIATTTTTTTRLTVTQQGHIDTMWKHFNEMFSELGKVFK